MMGQSEDKKGYGNPYLAGLLLGITLLASLVILGAGLGASGGLSRISAFLEGLVLPSHTLNSEYFGRWGGNPLNYYLVYMVIGVFLGGLFSALLMRRVKLGIEKGNKSSNWRRLVLSLVGGILAGFASRLAAGCTSGQALSGSALLLSGSIIFLISLFAGGYGAAYFVRRQWDD
jgi:uncharacterized membrane protein YedE/YeeE